MPLAAAARVAGPGRVGGVHHTLWLDGGALITCRPPAHRGRRACSAQRANGRCDGSWGLVQPWAWDWCRGYWRGLGKAWRVWVKGFLPKARILVGWTVKTSASPLSWWEMPSLASKRQR